MKIDIALFQKKDNKEPKNYSPTFDYCRKLITEGHDPREPLEVYRNGKLSYTVKSLEEGAKLKIRENDAEGPKFVKYNPDQRFQKAQENRSV